MVSVHVWQQRTVVACSPAAVHTVRIPERRTHNGTPVDRRHFAKAHQRVLKEFTEHESELFRIEQEKISEEIEKFMSELTVKTGRVKVRSRKYMIVLPKSADDLKEEGRTLHHCVATYAERVAKGQTMILFVRKVEEPEKPFFTMEWKDHHVVQCRGSHNCAMPKDVEAFVKAFEKRMKKGTDKKAVVA